MRRTYLKLLFFLGGFAFTKVECLPEAVSNACKRSEGDIKPVPEDVECWDTQVEYFNISLKRPTRRDARNLCKARGFEGLARFRGVHNAQNAKVLILKAFRHKGKLI